MPIFTFLGNDEWENEDSLKREIKNWLQEGAEDPLNREVFHGSEIKPDTFLEACSTLSLFSEKKAVIVRHGEKIPLAVQNKLVDTLNRPMEDTGVFFLFEKLDGRSKLKKVLQSKGVLKEHKLPYANKIPDWLSARCHKKFGRKIAPHDARFLADFVGENIHELEQELQKLDTYLPKGQAITAKDIEALIAPHGETNLFDLLFYMGMRKKSEALLALKSIVEGPTPPFLIAIRLFYHCLNLLKIQSSLAKGMRTQEIAQQLNINPYIFEKKQYPKQAMSRTESMWKKILIRLSELEFEFKRGKYSEPFQIELAFASIM